MKKITSIMLFTLLIGSSFADQVVTQSNEPQGVTSSVQQPANAQPITNQNVQQPAHKKTKPQRPKFNRNEIWCGDTHISNQNADHLGDYCKHFGYKHNAVEFRDDRSGKLVRCQIKETGQVNKSTCHTL